MRTPKKHSSRQRRNAKARPDKHHSRKAKTTDAAAQISDQPAHKPAQQPTGTGWSAQHRHGAARRKQNHKIQRFSKNTDTGVHLFGIHAVAAALGNPRRKISQLRLTDGAARKLAKSTAARGIRPEPIEPKELDRLLGPDQVHQGALLIGEPLPEPSLDDLAETSIKGGGPVVILDQVTDPHNVGAILRSAAVFGAAGIVMTRRNSPPLGGTLAKSASGALEHLPIALVTNLARAMRELKDLGLQCIGLDGDARQLLQEMPLDCAAAVVLGAEGAGLRRLTRDNCDLLCQIKGSGPLQSLNVSNAAAVALYLASMRRAPAR